MFVNGDVIFVNYTNTENLKAISKVEDGFKNINYNHVGMYVDGYIIDATPDGVNERSLNSFIKNADENILIARHPLQNDAAIKIKDFIGYKYNQTFIQSTEKFYCSELIHYVFELVNGKELFKKHKLSFKDDNNTISDYWKKYYETFDMDVPINEMGSNPQNLSNSDVFSNKINILKGEIKYEKNKSS